MDRQNARGAHDEDRFASTGNRGQLHCIVHNADIQTALVNQHESFEEPNVGIH